jgi:hypothetical protein
MIVKRKDPVRRGYFVMPKRVLRVLCIDGGGMRGIYTAAYIEGLVQRFAAQRNVPGLDFGKAFKLIVGTSTGAIVACGLAAGVQPAKLCQIYRNCGPKIFPIRLPQELTINWVKVPNEFRKQILDRPKYLAQGAEALKEALTEQFGERTLGQIYREREIALAVPAVEMSNHAAWVFKTPHLEGRTTHRDSHYSLVDVCMATSAAPIFRSLAAIKNPDTPGSRVFCDGGLWANSPVLVGLIEALKIAEEDEVIEIYCLSTCPRPSGEQVREEEVNRGLAGWKFGGAAVALSLDAQEFVTHHMARMLIPHLKHEVRIIRFPADKVPASIMDYLDLDETRPEAMDALISQANTDVNLTTSRCSDANDSEGQLMCQLMLDMPVVSVPVNC